MKIFIDCEFNGHGGELISFALVPEDTNLKPLYIILDYKDKPEEWVRDNVIPVLGDSTRLSRQVAARRLEYYLNDIESPLLVSDWPADIVYIADLMITSPGRMIKLDKCSFCFINSDFKTADASKIPHNALEDAIALRDFYIGE